MQRKPSPSPITRQPQRSSVPRLPAKPPRLPRASASVALCHSLMNSAGSAHLGSPRVPGCGRQWKNEGATVEEASRPEGAIPAGSFRSCREAPASVCPHAAASPPTGAWTCHSSTACPRTLSLRPPRSAPSLLPPVIPALSTSPSSGPSPFPMSRSACRSTKWKRHRRPALQTPRPNWAGVAAREPGPRGVSRGAGPNPACSMTKRWR